MSTRLPEPLSAPWELEENLSATSGSQTLADGRSRYLWLVFVLLRHRPGVYTRVIRAPDCLAAERAATTDREVLETLGSQLLGRGLVAGGAETVYRSLGVVGRRFLTVRHKGPSGSTLSTRVPFVEVLTPRPGR